METLNIDLGDRSYPVLIGSDLLQRHDLIQQYIHGQSCLTVSNATVAPLYLHEITAALSGLKHDVCILPDGESYKTLDTLNSIYTHLLNGRYDRSTTLLALGGGVVGDMTGFAAASYQRGVNFIQVPTTLLAMVDSSVGGKTGVNHPLGKNMIGAFHQPQAVIIDTDTLDTLDDRQLKAGLAEVIKYGLIVDSEFLSWLEEHTEALLNRDKPALTYAIKRSCQIKADIVAKDEKEHGCRALLNLGHTFGHAIETGMGYGTWLHGEAISTGMMLAASMSARLGWIGDTQVERIKNILLRFGLPVHTPETMTDADFIQLMAVDKKVINGQLRLVLLQDIGKAVVTTDFDQSTLEQTLANSRA